MTSSVSCVGKEPTFLDGSFFGVAMTSSVSGVGKSTYHAAVDTNGHGYRVTCSYQGF